MTQTTNAPPKAQATRGLTALLWIVRIAALCASVGSAYLLWHAFQQGAVAGCAGGSDCGYILGSRWSRVVGVPVAGLALGAYLLVLLASAWAGPRTVADRRRAAWAILVCLSVAIATAATYFIVLQATVLHGFCPWCLGVHACGAIVALAVLTAIALGRRGPVALSAMPMALAIGLGLLGVGAVAAGQFLLPGGYKVETLANGVRVQPGEWPTLGPADAPHVIALVGDYTCPHCRQMHQWMDEARAEYGQRLAIVILPMPLNSHCNARVKQDNAHHRYACELNRLSLAVWRADPARWPQMDHWLFDPVEPPTPDDAHAFAAGLVGAEKLRAAEADPWVGAALQHDVDVYGQLGGGPIPKLLVGQQVLQGPPPSGGEVMRLIEKQFPIRR